MNKQHRPSIPKKKRITKPPRRVNEVRQFKMPPERKEWNERDRQIFGIGIGGIMIVYAMSILIKLITDSLLYSCLFMVVSSITFIILVRILDTRWR